MANNGTSFDPLDPRVLAIVNKGFERLGIRVNQAAGILEITDRNGNVVSQTIAQGDARYLQTPAQQPLAGGSNQYRADQGFGTLGDGSTHVYHFTRRRMVAQCSGSLEGFEWFNGSGANSPTVNGETPNANVLSPRAALSVGSATGVGIDCFNDLGLRQPTVDPGGKATMRLKGGRVRIAKGDVVWINLGLAATAATDQIPYTSLIDQQIGEGVAYYTSAQSATWLAKIEQFPATGLNGQGVATYPPPTRIPGTGPTRLLITPDNPRQVCWGLVGTSRMDGMRDPYATTPLDDDGAYGRALAARSVPFVRLSKGASAAYVDCAPAAFAMRMGLLRSCTHVLFEHAQNDLYQGRTVAQMQADALAFCGPLRAAGQIVVGTTCYPYANDASGAFILASAQTVNNAAYEARRRAWNGWVRGTISDAALLAAGGDPTILRSAVFDDYVEAADPVESVRDSGVFKDAALLVSGTATGGSATTLVDSAVAWTPGAMRGRTLAYSVGGTTYYAYVVANNATTLYLTTLARAGNGSGAAYDLGSGVATAPAAASAYSVYGAMVPDGLHASEAGRALVGTAFGTVLTRLGM